MTCMRGVSKLLEPLQPPANVMFHTLLFDLSFTYIHVPRTVYTQSLISIEYGTFVPRLAYSRMYIVYSGYVQRMFYYILATALNHSCGIHADGKTQTDNSYPAQIQLKPPKTKQLFIQQTCVHTHTRTHTHKFHQRYSISTCTRYTSRIQKSMH